MPALIRELTVPGFLADLGRIADFIETVCAEANVPPEARFDLQLAVEEACSNVIEHAYGNQGGELRIRFETRRDDVIITLHDRGRPFDPHSVPAPELAAPLDERPIGGLGLFMMRKLMDSVRFSFSLTDGNTLVMTKRRVAPTASPRRRRKTPDD
jgi:anti-sigma regulatory factor (Ser/Thr protein kinase)